MDGGDTERSSTDIQEEGAAEPKPTFGCYDLLVAVLVGGVFFAWLLLIGLVVVRLIHFFAQQ
jgi:hypothetical protein